MSDSATANVPSTRLLPLFLVCFASIGFEIALTRFFSIASWSEYGYWIISMTMVGLAASGIVVSLFQRAIVRHAGRLLPAMPAAMMLAAALGWTWITVVPFNPLELQNKQLWTAQLVNIAQYYAAIFPFFFLVGLYISVYFTLHSRRIGRVYAFDLAGAGCGAMLTLGLMFVVHPFYLTACLLPALALAGWLESWRRPSPAPWRAATLATLAATAGLVVFLNQARVNEYKEIFPPLNTQDSRIEATRISPKGLYQLLDNFTERHDTDISNNVAAAGGAALPRAYGLYADGNRLAALPKPGPIDAAYAAGALDALPYNLAGKGGDVLLIGAAGGFRIHEALYLGARNVLVVEPDAILRSALLDGLGPSPAFTPVPGVAIVGTSPLAPRAFARPRGFDVIDIGREFLSQSDTNKAVLATEVLAGYMALLADDGVLSLPVSIREFTVYAVKMLATARRALELSGVAEPEKHMVVYRSAWNVRVLLSRKPWTAQRIAAIRAFCEERSFDLTHLPGVDPASIRIFNELPVVSFDAASAGGRPGGGGAGAADPMSEEARAMLDGAPSPYHGFFKLTPPSLDRPFWNAVLPLTRIGTILDRVELVPREELVYLINLAVLAQALVLAAIVLLLPLLRRGEDALPARQFLKSAAYFAGLGLGFLFVEIYLIEKSAHYLHDKVTAFGLVLAAMLVFSGLGSLLADRFQTRPARGLALAVAAILAWCMAMFWGLDPLLTATGTAPLPVKALIVAALAVPASIALGMPMSLGLAQFQGRRLSFLPWAWAVNGACSIISTPLANLLAVSIGLKTLLLGAVFLYVVVLFCLPIQRRPA